uniref:Ubiquitin carboxyl-terminal hydrolase n=1 Tax=Leersia perrieri TaxID=77586 RepID=A0A0D9XA13_9ORYZ
MARETREGRSPQNPPESGCGDTAASSNAEGWTCAHWDHFQAGMPRFILKLRSSKRAPRCEHYLCENKVEKGSILVCIGCKLQFCIGDGTKDNPQGHARWHFNLEQHCVGALFSDPETLYCFLCEHRLDLDASNMHRRHVSSEKEETDCGWIYWALLQAISIGTERERCEHFMSDEDHVSYIVTGIRLCEYVPVCGACTSNIAGEVCFMVCLECETCLCANHACLHAVEDQHWVALYHEAPNAVYCFACKQAYGIGFKEDDEEMTDNGEVPHEESQPTSVSWRTMGNSLPQIDHVSDGLANWNAHAIKGILNLGNTCYLNALVQCLLVLGKLRARMLGPDAPSGTLGTVLHDLFEQTYGVDSTRRSLLDTSSLLDCVRRLDSKFEGAFMQDSHELLCCLRNHLYEEDMMMSPPNMQDGALSAVPPTVFHSIFGGQLSSTKLCKFCSLKSVSHVGFCDLSVALPLKGSLSKSKIAVHGPLRTPKDKVQGKAVDFLPQNMLPDVKVEELDLTKTDTHVPEDIGPPPPVSPLSEENARIKSGSDVGKNYSGVLDDAFNKRKISSEAKTNTSSEEITTENKEKTHSNDLVCDKAQYINSIASIDECLELHFKAEMMGWTCENCSKVAQKPGTILGKYSEPMMSSTTEDIADDGDQSEQSEKIACQSEQCNKKTGCHEGVQEAVPSCVPAEKQANLLSGQNKNATILDKGRAKRVKLHHSAHQVEENQNEKKDKCNGAIQTLISKLPPVLVIHLIRNLLTHKVIGHVSFKEIFHVGLFVDPSSEDKDNLSYRLVGVIEHCGPFNDTGHFLAYVRASPRQQTGGSSSWFRASDDNIKEVSVEEVLKCEAYILFYERVEG